MKITRRIRKMVWNTLFAFHRSVQKNPNRKFIDRAYYISFGSTLISIKPYFGWKNAYRAAKAKHSKAFIIRGSTLNLHLDQSRWQKSKQAWSAFGAR